MTEREPVPRRAKHGELCSAPHVADVSVQVRHQRLPVPQLGELWLPVSAQCSRKTIEQTVAFDILGTSVADPNPHGSEFNSQI
jgi:hypothetical protein